MERKMQKRDEVERPMQLLEYAIQLGETSGASQELMDIIKKVRNAFSAKKEFTEESCSPHSEACQKVEDETYAHDWQLAFQQGHVPRPYSPAMVCGQVQGQFLKTLVSIHKPKRILEVGMFTGYSALSMAEALPADGEVVTVDFVWYLKQLVENLIKDSPHSKKIKIATGKGTEELSKMVKSGEKFDFIFLDANKTEYVDQFKIIFDDNLLSPGGLVVVDNAYHVGQVYMFPEDPTNLGRTTMNAIKERHDLHRVLLPLNDGVLLLRRKCDVEGAVE